MEPEQIQAELFRALGPNGWQTVRHLMLKLKKENSDKVLDALLGIFFESGDNYRGAQGAAGRLFDEAKAEVQKERARRYQTFLAEVGMSSIEELPWYLAEVLGIEKCAPRLNSVAAA